MALWPTTKPALRARISSYRRTLRQEYDANGMWGDGYGKRRWLFPLYFMLGEDDEVRTYIDWYVANFPDDSHDPGQSVCWALILHRIGREDEALYRLVQAVDENLSAVAKVVGDYQGPYGMWGEELQHLYDLDDDLIAAMTGEERAWLAASWRSSTMAAMRERHIAIGREVATLPVSPRRTALLEEQRALVAGFKPAEMPPLSTGDPEAWLMVGRKATPERRGSGKVICTTPDVWRRVSGTDHR